MTPFSWTWNPSWSLYVFKLVHTSKDSTETVSPLSENLSSSYSFQKNHKISVGNTLKYPSNNIGDKKRVMDLLLYFSKSWKMATPPICHLLHVTEGAVYVPIQRNITYIHTVRQYIYKTIQTKHHHLPFCRYEWHIQLTTSSSPLHVILISYGLIYATPMSTPTHFPTFQSPQALCRCVKRLLNFL